jgi:hypothetical protein
MDKLVMDKLMKKIPYYVIHRCIIPYTYELQPRRLLVDIRSFVNDYAMLENTYLLMYNSRILFNDLIFYCNGNMRDLTNIYDLTSISQKYLEILRRHVAFHCKSQDDINSRILDGRYSIRPYQYLSRSRFLWGLLTPFERSEFINEYLLNDMDQDT